MLLDNCVDRSGAIHYNQYDRTRVETSWRQRLRKESDAVYGKQQPGFQMNLANQNGSGGLLALEHSHNRIEIVTEKEHKQAPNARRSLKGMDPKSFEVLAIKHLSKTPSHKWDLSELESHEYGWLQGDFVRASTLKPSRTTNADSSARAQASASKSDTSKSGPPAGSLAATTLSSFSAPGKKTIVMVANDHILRRVQSAPSLPTGPRAGEVKELNAIKWRRPMRTCEVTQYAEIYRSLLKHNPFNQAAAGR
jgi:hypothetical protein